MNMLNSIKRLEIISLGKDIPHHYIRAAKLAKEKISNLELVFGRAPDFPISYPVASPLVKYSGEEISNIAYGKDGFEMIQDVITGKIR